MKYIMPLKGSKVIGHSMVLKGKFSYCLTASQQLKMKLMALHVCDFLQIGGHGYFSCSSVVEPDFGKMTEFPFEQVFHVYVS